MTEEQQDIRSSRLWELARKGHQLERAWEEAGGESFQDFARTCMTIAKGESEIAADDELFRSFTDQVLAAVRIAGLRSSLRAIADLDGDSMSDAGDAVDIAEDALERFRCDSPAGGQDGPAHACPECGSGVSGTLGPEDIPHLPGCSRADTEARDGQGLREALRQGVKAMSGFRGLLKRDNGIRVQSNHLPGDVAMGCAFEDMDEAIEAGRQALERPDGEEGDPRRKVWWCRDCGFTGDCGDLDRSGDGLSPTCPECGAEPPRLSPPEDWSEQVRKVAAPDREPEPEGEEGTEPIGEYECPACGDTGKLYDGDTRYCSVCAGDRGVDQPIRRRFYNTDTRSEARLAAPDTEGREEPEDFQPSYSWSGRGEHPPWQVGLAAEKLAALMHRHGYDEFTVSLARPEEAGGEDEGRHRDPVAEWDELPNAASQLDQDDLDGMSDHDLGAMLKLASDLADDLIGREAAERLMNADRLRGAPKGAGETSLPFVIKERLLSARDAFVEEDYEEVWHHLYQIADFYADDPSSPWDSLRTGREERDDG